ncbi:MAG: RAMP superfamily CRISPR-associated protein, partial [Candidatus Methanomethyliaceae archaeon]
MNPKHTNPTERSMVAHAPYNFVPLPEEIVKVNYDIPPHDRYFCANHYTGYVECDLKTLTPTYVRTGLNRNLFPCPLDNVREIMMNRQTRKAYGQFFSLDDSHRPVIPGSTLRGATRALLEIVGYGKIHWVTDKNLFFRTLDNSGIGDHYRGRMGGKVESGFLYKRGEKYLIKKCEMFRVRRKQLGGIEKIYYGSAPNQYPKWDGTPSQYARIWVSLPQKGQVVQEIAYSPTEDYLEGRLVITGNVPNDKDKKEKKEFVFLLPEAGAEE